MNNKKNDLSQIGFTLIELMITVAVLGIIIATALPSYSEFTRRQALKSTAQVLVKALTNARVEAVTSGQASSTACWNLGAAAINLPGADANQMIGAGEIVVFRNALLNGAVEIISQTQLVPLQQNSRVVDNDADNCITFDGQGRLTPIGAATTSFLFCRGIVGDNINSLTVDISGSGRIVLNLNTNAAGVLIPGQTSC